MALTFSMFLAGLGACWAIQRLAHSSILTISLALAIGILSFGLDLKIDPLFDSKTNTSANSPISRRDKIIWIALFLPPLVIMGALLIRAIRPDLSGRALRDAVFLALFLGYVIGGTSKVLFDRGRSVPNAQDIL
ncbi:MAG TPA: hypothetical protein VIC34_13190 [Croceibacterium sp.]|jgi:hypothetical protein